MEIKPLKFWKSFLLTIIPAGTAALIIHRLIPSILRKNEIPFLYLYLPWWLCYMGLYFAAGIIAYKLEGNPINLTAFKTRYRLRVIEGEDWRWLGALLGTFIIAIAGLNFLGVKLSSIPMLSMPVEFPPELNPSHPSGMIPGEFMGLKLKGQWWLVIVYFIGWVINIFGEEFWFRGYMLPRQEAAYGKQAWISHGIIWAVNHLFQVWTLVILFPYAFLWSYFIQRGKNTWIPIIVHGLGNFIPLVVIIIGVIGN